MKLMFLILINMKKKSHGMLSNKEKSQRKIESKTLILLGGLLKEMRKLKREHA